MRPFQINARPAARTAWRWACDIIHISEPENPYARIMNAGQHTGSGLWKHGLLLTLLFGFTVMIVGGVMMYKSRAPIPGTVVGPCRATLFTAADIQAGQELFRKRGLMDYGSVLGHGAYLGPDYTAEALHWMTEAMRARNARQLRVARRRRRRPRSTPRSPRS